MLTDIKFDYKNPFILFQLHFSFSFSLTWFTTITEVKQCRHIYTFNWQFILTKYLKWKRKQKIHFKKIVILPLKYCKNATGNKNKLIG